MNEKIPVSNNTAMPMYVAGMMIPPGETRHFDPEQVPVHLRPAPVAEPKEETQFDPIEELRAGTVKEIVAQIPELADDVLEALGAAEQSDKNPRTSLLSAIAEEQLTRAEAKTAEDEGKN